MATAKPHGSTYLTASGAVGIAGKPKIIYAVNFVSTGTAGVLVLKNNGSGGTTYITENGTISKGTSFNYGEGFFFPTDCYCTVDANTSYVLISYDEY